MRRKDREVTEIGQLEAILGECKTCHLAMLDEDRPYVVPLSYGYRMTDGTLTLYFHCAKEGKKLDLLRKNNRVSFSICREGEPVYAAKDPCNSGYDYASVLGVGRAVFVEETREKCLALSLLMERQAGIAVAFTKEQADAVCVFKVIAEERTGKRKAKP